MKRRALLVLLVALATLLVSCQPPQEFGPNATDSDLWEAYDIRIDTEVPEQYPNGRSGLTGAGAEAGGAYGAEPESESDH